MEIKCPECGQKFSSESPRQGREQECPACLFRFIPQAEQHTDEQPGVIQGQTPPAKQAPAQKDENYYRRRSVRTNTILEREDLEQMAREARKRKPHPPVQGWQYILIASGLTLAALIWALMRLGEMVSSTFLSSMDVNQLRIFAAFFGCFAGALIWIGARGQLWWCRLIALAVALSLPLSVQEEILPEGETVDRSTVTLTHGPEIPQPDATIPASIDEYSKSELEPLLNDIMELGAQKVLAVWVRGLDNANEKQVTSYLRRMTEIRIDPKLYPRDTGGLFVINNSPLSYQDFLAVLSRVGDIQLTDPENRLVDLTLKTGLFRRTPPADTLQQPGSDGFTEANYKELCSLDMARIEAAAKRLAASPGNRQMRTEIVTQLNQLISEPWGFDGEYLKSLATALALWAPLDDERSLGSVALAAKGLHEGNKDVEPAMIDYIVRARYKSAPIVLVPYWMDDPYRWEESMTALGGAVEEPVLRTLAQTDSSRELKASSIRILEKTGTAKSLDPLGRYLDHQDRELANLAAAAVREIRERIAAASTASPDTSPPASSGANPDNPGQ